MCVRAYMFFCAYLVTVSNFCCSGCNVNLLLFCWEISPQLAERLRNGPQLSASGKACLDRAESLSSKTRIRTYTGRGKRKSLSCKAKFEQEKKIK